MRPWYRIVSYRIEKKTLISYRYRIESKKSLSLLAAQDQVIGKHHCFFGRCVLAEISKTQHQERTLSHKEIQAKIKTSKTGPIWATFAQFLRPGSTRSISGKTGTLRWTSPKPPTSWCMAPLPWTPGEKERGAHQKEEAESWGGKSWKASQKPLLGPNQALPLSHCPSSACLKCSSWKAEQGDSSS